jgi:hypothetical protein
MSRFWPLVVAASNRAGSQVASLQFTRRVLGRQALKQRPEDMGFGVRIQRAQPRGSRTRNAHEADWRQPPWSQSGPDGPRPECDCHVAGWASSGLWQSGMHWQGGL